MPSSGNGRVAQARAMEWTTRAAVVGSPRPMRTSTGIWLPGTSTSTSSMKNGLAWSTKARRPQLGCAPW